jgi:acetyltransferase-like isoleucine patch superfamily enzyme
MSIIIARTAIVDPRVELGDDSVIEDYVVLGSSTAADDAPPLRIGSGARIRSHTVVYPASKIGDRFHTGHGAMIRESNTIGDDVSIGTHSIVEHHVEIGDRVRVHSNAFIPEYSVIEEGAWIGPSVTFTNARYPLGRDAKASLRGPIVRRGAKIGANATLLPGVVIGRDALVGAGSVVVRDVPDGAVVVGNPARVVRQVADIEEYRAG